VTVGAQAAKLTEPERCEVASVRLDMVSDGRWRDAAIFQAKPTQRLDHELIRSAALPAGGAIPAMNFRTMRHRGQGLPVFYIFQAARARCVKNQTRLVCRIPRIFSGELNALEAFIQLDEAYVRRNADVPTD